MSKRAILWGAVCAIALATSGAAGAPARIDQRYGTQGVTNVARVGEETMLHGATATGDGGVVAFGRGYGRGAAAAGSALFARYTPGGMLDKTFSRDGIAVLRIASFDPRAATVAPDGSVIAAGYRRGHHGWETILIKLAPNGAPDAGFGTAGVVVLDPEGIADIRRLLLQPDGKILVAEERHGWAIRRLDATGAADPTFGVNGEVTGPMRAFTSFALGAVEAAPGGSIVIAGEYENIGYEPAVAPESGSYVARFLANGQPDASFGEAGVRTVPFRDGATDVSVVRILSDGSVATVGVRDRADVVMMRLTPRGALDSTFAGDGIATQDIGLGRVLASVIDASGAVTIERTHLIRGSSFLHRYVGGRFDRSFAPGGSVLPVSFWLVPGTVMLSTPKGLVLAGTRNVSKATGIAAIRLLP